MHRLRRNAVLAALAIGAVVAGVRVLAQRPSPFPHDEHASLFPLCEGCHTGVPSGDRAAFYPPPAQCIQCHDGTEVARVEWQGPSESVDNVVFSHPAHAARDSTSDCTTCHTRAGGPRMAIEDEPVVPRCLECHAHRAEEHFADARCETCHMPLADAPFDRVAILGLPYPRDHETGSFIREDHGTMAQAGVARCATCHTRERCESCHVDAASVASIAQMPVAGGLVARSLPQFAAHYPVPASHQSSSFLETHGAEASRAACATCHVREDCITCHVPPQPVVVTDMPARRDTRAPGVQVVRRAPSSHRAPQFAMEHGNASAAAGATCTACHRASMCVDCHDAAATGAPALVARGLATDTQSIASAGSFHPPNYVGRHSAEAYARRLECSNCHDSRVFCADCHASAGMSSARVSGRLGPGFHDAEPLWLLRHGQAARQALESCSSCHKQSECMQCHSVFGAFKINPHGPAFDAGRAQKRNAAICLACHLGNPLEGGTP